MREVKTQENVPLKVYDNVVPFYKYNFGNCLLSEGRSPFHSNWLSLSKQAFINSCSQISLDDLKLDLPNVHIFKLYIPLCFRTIT
jgi:hypothetical protein